jgi:N-acetylmuramoyl-L-alanine amidase
MRRSPAPILLYATLLAAACSANAGELRSLTLVQDDAVTRASLDLPAIADARVFTLANPARLVVDLPATALAPGVHLPGANGLVANVRSGQPEPGTLRIVFDLDGTATESHRIDRIGGTQRLVVELRDPAWKPAPQPVRAPPPPRIEPTPVVAAPTPATTAEIAPPPTPVADVAKVAAAPVVASRAPTPAPTKRARDVASGHRDLVVAIDAGHGGKDPGAHGPSGLQEKRVTLAVARELAARIESEPGMRAVLIRDDDTFVPLERRFQKARAAQADLFISIHADAAPSQAASGASVFVLSTRGASSQAARWLADKENAADLVGGVSLDDKDRSLSAVLLDLSQSATMRMSDDIAQQVLAELKNIGKAHKREVERANFVVLRSPDVPSMLVETGFITNPDEERKLDDPAYRRRLAGAIVGGVRGYFTRQPVPGTWFAARADDAADDDATALLAANVTYVVGRGETLSGIAARHGIEVDSLRAANRRHGDRVRAGERLTIPSAQMVAGNPQ